MKKIILIVLYSFILRYFLKIFLGIKYQNRQVLNTTDQFIIVANHNSHLDAVVILSALPSSIIDKTHPVAAADYFANSGIKKFLSKTFVNTLLIPRKRPEKEGDPDPIELMCQKLQQGRSLILFPEGTRGEPEVMQRFRKGIGLLLERFPHIKVIPVYLEGLGKSLPKGDMVLVPFNSKALFGEPVTIEHAAPEDMALQIEHKVIDLKTK